MDTETSQGTRKPRLTKKQFIIAIIAVCSIALLVEGGLLVRMFYKKKQAKNNPLADYQKGVSGYICNRYICRDDGSRKQDVVMLTVEFDEDGRVCRKCLYGRGKGNSSQREELSYAYDANGRIHIITYKEFGSNADDDRTSIWVYEYDERGFLVSETSPDSEGAFYWSYNQYGDVISLIKVDSNDGQTSAYYVQGGQENEMPSENGTIVFLDDQGRVSHMLEGCQSHADGYYADYESWFFFSEDTETVERKETFDRDGNCVYEAEYDSQGRIVFETAEISIVGNEAEYFTFMYEWDYNDSNIPENDVLRISEYKGKARSQIGESEPQRVYLCLEEEYRIEKWNEDAFLFPLTNSRYYSPWRNFERWDSWQMSTYWWKCVFPENYAYQYWYYPTEEIHELRDAVYAARGKRILVKPYSIIDREEGIILDSVFSENGNQLSKSIKKYYNGAPFLWKYDDRGNVTYYKHHGWLDQWYEFEYTYY